MENKPIPRVCGSCAYLVTEEGEPYYCAIKDLYTEARADDKACADALIAELNKKKEWRYGQDDRRSRRRLAK